MSEPTKYKRKERARLATIKDTLLTVWQKVELFTVDLRATRSFSGDSFYCHV